MVRLLVIAAVICVMSKMALGRWPWEFLAPKPTRAQAVFRARKLLGVGSEASHSDILVAHKRLIATVHPDRGGTNEQVHEANAARDLLLDELPYQSGDH
ncbi:MAG: molecular chaperone DnaJ [Sphingomonadales bacterium]|nr:molecular chaperone DnaJ [Sphingomonadales bacterium]MBD3774267.1 molecular chaperone DnaJ [Paracoccaceae bacterium]